MSDMDVLIWARSTGFQLAAGIFLLGMLLRWFEMLSLGRKPDLAVARSASPGSGWRTVWSRSFYHSSTLFKQSHATHILGYTFHIGLFVTLFFLAAHIQLIRGVTGLSWPALPTPLVDGVALVTIAALVAVVVLRLRDPVKRFLSRFEDYFTLALTLLPLVTGYMAYHHLLLPYTWMLAVHILSAELLLVFMPFTKLMHFSTLFLARWYNGDIAGKKGVAS